MWTLYFSMAKTSERQNIRAYTLLNLLLLCVCVRACVRVCVIIMYTVSKISTAIENTGLVTPLLYSLNVSTKQGTTRTKTLYILCHFMSQPAAYTAYLHSVYARGLMGHRTYISSQLYLWYHELGFILRHLHGQESTLTV